MTRKDLLEKVVKQYRCLRYLLLVMCTYPRSKKALTLHLARGEGRERYFACNLMQRKILASSYQYLMAEAPIIPEYERCNSLPRRHDPPQRSLPQ